MIRLVSQLSNQTIAAMAIVSLVASAFAYHHYEASQFEAELTHIAQERLDEYLAGVPNRDYWQGVTTVATSQEFGVFGERRALLHIFVRNTAPDAPKEQKFRGFEYSYQHDGKKWVNTGSASCTAKEHFGDGLKLFAEMDRKAAAKSNEMQTKLSRKDL